MKSILISIHPKWCDLIASGEKTIEVRKTRPKIETPFKCYIYETKARSDMPTFVDEDGHVIYTGRGQVIGEFACDDIKTYYADDFVGAVDLDGTEITEPKDGEFAYWIPEEKETCLPYEEILAYGNGKTLYGWHISDLKIYDKPKEFSEFWRAGKCPYASENGCTYESHCFRAGQIERCGETLTSPPRSWCYVEDPRRG